MDINGDPAAVDAEAEGDDEEDELAFLDQISEDDEQEAADSSSGVSTVDGPPVVPVKPEDLRQVC
jgi:hypothetical protein